MKYPAGKDWGTACAFILFVSACISGGVVGIATAGVGAGIALLPTALPWVWFWFGTSYEITSSHVIIRFGPLSSRVGIHQILEAVPTTSAWLMAGGRHGRFALSRDAILINSSRKVWGFLPYAVLISPADKPGFLQALAEASPELDQSEDGAVRRRAAVSGQPVGQRVGGRQ